MSKIDELEKEYNRKMTLFFSAVSDAVNSGVLIKVVLKSWEGITISIHEDGFNKAPVYYSNIPSLSILKVNVKDCIAGLDNAIQEITRGIHEKA